MRLSVAACALAASVSGLLLVAAPGAHADPLDQARRLLSTGHYREAREAYRRLPREQAQETAIGTARAQRAIGDRDGALETLRAAVRDHRASPRLHAEIAELEFERGDYAAAQAEVDSALALDPDQTAARYFEAELHRVAGRLDEASDAYRWLVRYYNREQDHIRDPETLRWIGLGAAQYARWTRNSGQFHFLVRTLYPDALARDSLYWPAHLEMARLFIEKFNRPEAMTELDSALAINPNAAEAHAARARVALQQFDLDSAQVSIGRALAIDPQCLPALQLEADVRMMTTGAAEAIPALERARALNPADEETLGRLAAAYGVSDGLRDDPAGTRMGAVIQEATRRNPHAGAFFAALAASLDGVQRYPAAAHYYEEARRVMPQLIGVPGQLGMLAMRLADEPRARELLHESFQMDPFNVRVKNSLQVLDLLQGYDSLETEHFTIRYDPARDSLLARYAARHLEQEVYPEVVKAFGYAPRERSLIEIFSRAKGTSGHGWFSARMVGLPFIGTVGACAGRVVAITSPNDGRPFNWARVLKHEFVHVVNLEQTRFAIPRWFTEALAVRTEGPGHARVWDRVLERRLAADSLFDLDTIHLGFVRPQSGEDWILAYYQAELYARFVADTRGPGAIQRLVGAYADQLETAEAIPRCFGMSEAAFEKDYRAYVERLAEPGRAAVERPETDRADLASLERAVEKHPKSSEALDRLARALLEKGERARAREIAERALAVDPKSQPAAYVLARVILAGGSKGAALEKLRAAFDPEHPDVEALVLYANLSLEARDYDEAERLALLGQERFPYAADWEAGLAGVYRNRGDRDRLARVLEHRAGFDHDDFGIRLELARLAIERGDSTAAARWATEAIDIDVMNPVAHATLAEGLAGSGEPRRAIEEYDAAIALDPSKPEWRLALARACVAAGNRARARSVLVDLLAREPTYPGARETLDGLGK